MDKTKINDYILDNASGTSPMAANTTDGVTSVSFINISSDPDLAITINKATLIKRKDVNEIYLRSVEFQSATSKPYIPMYIQIPIGGRLLVVEEVDSNMTTLAEGKIGS